MKFDFMPLRCLKLKFFEAKNIQQKFKIFQFYSEKKDL